MVTTDPGAAGTDFRIGAVLSLSFQILHQALGKFLVLSLLPVIPIVAVAFGFATAPQNAFAFVLIGLALYFIFAMISQAALVYGALEELRGRHFTIGEALSKGFRRFWPVLGVAIVSGLIVMVGSVLLLVPGLIALCMLYVAIPACVVEEWGVTQSLTRSAELTKGYRWPIFGLILLVIVGAAIVGAVLEAIVQAVWNVEYHPLRHDAALFTNIMRIRRLLGEDGSEIIRVTEDGYRFVPPRDFLFVIPR